MVKTTKVIAALLFAQYLVFYFSPAYCQDIAVLSSKKTSIFSSTVDAAVKTVKTNKKNAIVDVFYSEDDYISQIGSKEYDVIFTIGGNNAKTIIDNFKNTPVVFISLDSVDYDRSKDNVYSILLRIGSKKQIEIMKKIMPDLEKVGIIYGGSSSGSYEELSSLEDLKVKAEKVSSSFKIPSAIASFTASNIDAFLIVLDSRIYDSDSLAYVLNYAISNKIPTIGFSSALVKAGALASYTYDYTDLGTQAGEMILGILSRDLPAEKMVSPRKVGYVLNTKTAKSIGLNIPRDVIYEASEIY